ALIAVWLVYRRMRSRLQPLGLIREALLAIRDGEQAPAALAVNDGLGEEARAWNSMVTEMERANKQLVGQQLDELVRAREEQGLDLNSACDAMWYGVLLVDSDLRVTYANGAAAIYLRTKGDAMLGGKLADVVSDQHVAESVRRLFRARVRHRTAVELDKRGDNGSEVLRFTIRAIGQDDPTAAIIVVEDVTQQRVADESRNAFVTQVTHELRSPLTNIRLSAETAIEDGDQNPPVRAKCLNVINQEAKRLERVVSDMLSVAEIEAGTLELRKDDVRLDALFEELQSDYAAQANDRGIRLEFNLPPKLPVLKADRDKISLVLHNLVNNAIKYTRKGGRVIVNVDVEDGALLVDVIDTGIGIAKDDVDRVFQKFYRAKDPRVAEVTGSGLGLALARQVVRLHGGEVRVDSEPDKGSTFSVRLPIPARAA
ncbi:MAG: sensor histidine kinase, partial [Planctomycetota bacterium]